MEGPETSYERMVYGGVLGKVVGVYAGRPFEGWSSAAIEARWGHVDRYVHEEFGADLVVADDDISGTLTFVRGLEDSTLYADTPGEFFGDTWLNYLLEGKTVLWWGGMGHSTEHTAFLRLKHGVRAPASGSIARNGRTVAEQIGAQIFIDSFGLVAPGRPALAADLARRAARVSHDGEAVNAAAVVAAMVSAAFVEKDMDRILDAGLAQIDPASLVARVHRDVRAWAGADGDWRRTFARIQAAYGYDRYGGNCHVVPNHAVMVMAWCCAPDDFHRAVTIACTAGWDTDCNAANVGSVMGVKVGPGRVNETYDYQGPTADRIVLPTAEGTRGITDILTEALHLARIGRRIMGWPQPAPPKDGAWHHFSMPGALHGWRSDESSFQTRGAATVANPEGRAMEVAFDVGGPRPARVVTPILPAVAKSGSYAVVAVPRLYEGMRVTIEAEAVRVAGAPTACLFVKMAGPPGAAALVRGAAVALRPGRGLSITLAIPGADGWPVSELGIEIAAPARASGVLHVDSVRLAGRPRLSFPAILPLPGGTPPGWVDGMDFVRGPFSDDAEPQTRCGKNEGRGLLVTGTTDWTDYTFGARVGVHLADTAGIVARYQGLERYVALVKTPDALCLLRRHYGETVLAERPCRWLPDELHALALRCEGATVIAYLDGASVMAAEDATLGRGGAGVIVENGLMGFRDAEVL